MDPLLLAAAYEQERLKQNQQAQPEPDSLLDTLGKVSLGAGILAGGLYGARRFFAGPKLSSPPKSAVPPSVEATVRQAASVPQEVVRRQQVDEFTRQARSERMPGVRTADLSRTVAQPGAPTEEERRQVYSAVASKPESELPLVYRPKGGHQEDVLITDPNTGEMFRRGRSPASFAERYISLRPELRGQKTDLPIDRTPGTFKEFSQSASGIEQEADKAIDAVRGFSPRQYVERTGSLAPTDLTSVQESTAPLQQDQFINAVESGEDQQTGRTMQRLQSNEDLDLSQIELLEEMAERSRLENMEQDAPINQVASQLPDGLPVDQTEGLNILDLKNKQTVRITPRALSQEENENEIFREAQNYLRGLEVDTDFDYSAENRRQALQVQDRIKRAQALQSQAEQILAEVRGEVAPATQQLSPEDFAKQFNQKYREEVNPELKMVDNARQRAELLASQAASSGEDLESLLLGESSPIDANMQGGALRGGKINATGDIVYQDAAGAYASADTGLKTRLAQGKQFAERARLLNKLSSASDEDLTYLVAQGQQARANNQPISQIDSDTYRFASQVLRGRALKNPEPTRLQLDALDRARASVDASQRVLPEMRNPRPTLAPGPQQDVARAMETLRRGMAVEPSEPIPVFPSVQGMRLGFVTDMDPEEVKKLTPQQKLQLMGPVVSASDVYTGAAAEAAGPVIFTGKSKANTVIATPPITGSIRTSTGRYLTQDNPDVLGTVYNVAGTPANRAISAQVEQNAQDFLQDAIAGGLQQKSARSPEIYVTPGSPYGPAAPSVQGPRMPNLGLPGLEASKRTNYAQYQPGRSVPVPRSPFIGEMAGGTVVVVPPEGASTGIRRDIGAPSASIDLTRRGKKSKYFPLYAEKQFVTKMEPAPIGSLTQSPGLSRIGGMTEQIVQGAGGIPVIQVTSQGQKIAYPRMDKLVTVPGYGTSVVTNIPRYGIDPGAEDWRNDLMRSAYRRGGPIRTY